MRELSTSRFLTVRNQLAAELFLRQEGGVPTLSDFDRFDLTASDVAQTAGVREGVKLVHNLTDRGIIPFRKNGRSRLYSFASALAFDAMVRARGAGLPLSEGAKIAEIVTARAKGLIGRPYNDLRDMKAWQWLIYAFDRDCDPPHIIHGFASNDERVGDLQVTLLSGWPSDVTSLFPIDRAIWEVANGYDRARKAKTDE